ncbi:hypothetical protein J7S19_01625 [Corynebacterium pyruviciproducens]|uniref:hypothetical protein n=1 Tax=Corynebacterium pyruviciproducens TaxID=598660 RepID=UPI002458D3A3|nr:hypothetical protein [Corynebacterium pyruviciproducens]MDH4657328.1 hypothetical protein [Corynebacterium pyruviciproducens]
MPAVTLSPLQPLAERLYITPQTWRTPIIEEAPEETTAPYICAREGHPLTPTANYQGKHWK